MLFGFRPVSESMDCFPFAEMGALSGVPLSKRLLAAICVMGAGVLAAYALGPSHGDSPKRPEPQVFTNSSNVSDAAGRLAVQPLDYNPADLNFYDNSNGDSNGIFDSGNLRPGECDRRIIRRVCHPIVPEEGEPSQETVQNKITDASQNCQYTYYYADEGPIPESEKGLPTHDCYRYKTSSGDTLYSISLRFFNTKDHWDKIFIPNDKVLDHSKPLASSMLLFIPVEIDQ